MSASLFSILLTFGLRMQNRRAPPLSDSATACLGVRSRPRAGADPRRHRRKSTVQKNIQWDGVLDGGLGRVASAPARGLERAPRRQP